VKEVMNFTITELRAWGAYFRIKEEDYNNKRRK